MNAAAIIIIIRLSARGVALTTDGNHLHARPASRVTADDLEAIRHHKPAIIRLLRQMIEAADPAADEPPHPLEPREKASLARLVRLEHKVSGDREHLRDVLACDPDDTVTDAHIRDVIEACETDAPMRAYLLTLATEVTP